MKNNYTIFFVICAWLLSLHAAAQKDSSKVMHIKVGQLQYQNTELKNPPQQTGTVINPVNIPVYVVPDSITTLRATDADFANLQSSFGRVIDYLKYNPDCEGNMYIDLETDFIGIEQITKYCHYAQSDNINQLSFNLNLLENMLHKPHLEDADVDAMKMILKNTYALRRSLPRFPIPMMSSFLPSRMLNINMLDSAGKTIHDATCYLLTRRKCRDCNCLTCNQNLNNCKPDFGNLLEVNRDFKFEAINNDSLLVPCGKYNMFVVRNNKVVKYSVTEIVKGNTVEEKQELKVMVK